MSARIPGVRRPGPLYYPGDTGKRRAAHRSGPCGLNGFEVIVLRLARLSPASHRRAGQSAAKQEQGRGLGHGTGTSKTGCAYCKRVEILRYWIGPADLSEG